MDVSLSHKGLEKEKSVLVFVSCNVRGSCLTLVNLIQFIMLFIMLSQLSVHVVYLLFFF